MGIMTNVAYLLFTFFACLAGLGLGLLLHHFWAKAKAVAGKQPDPFASIADGETTSWDAYTKWQADNNRRFAAQVISCGATPLLLAGAAWSERSDVVKSVCSSFTQIIGQAYICM
jgi:hypothetical protein